MKRADRRAELERVLWERKRRDARTPGERAAVEWDLARKLIAQIDNDATRTDRWKRLTRVVSDFNATFGAGDVQ